MNTTITTTPAASDSKATLWTGRILTGLLAAFLLFDAITKIFPNHYVIEASAKLGWTTTTLLPLGLILLASTILYLMPRTSLIGAILLTAYLGGATASSIQAGAGFIFPVLFGAIVWAALALTHSHHRNAIFSTFR